MYRFVNVSDDSGSDVDPVAKSINTQTMAINNMGKTINGIASTVVALKNIALHNLNEEQRKLKTKFKPKYAKQQQNPFKSLMLNVKAYKVKGFLESMLSFLGSLLKLFIIRPILNWLSDPANKTKLSNILEKTYNVLKGITEFLSSQFVHAINELHDVLSGETSPWKKITSFTKLWFKFAVGFLAIKFLRNPVKLLRSVARVGNLFERRANTAKTQLIKRKKFLTGGKWSKGRWLLNGAIGATALYSIAALWFNQAQKEQSGDDSSSNSSSGKGDRSTDRAYSLKEFGEDLTSDMYNAMGMENPNDKKKDQKNMWNPKNWFGGKKDKESKKDGEQPNALGVLAGMYTANEQFKHLFKTFKKESDEFGGKMNDADGGEKAQLLLSLAATVETALGSKNQMFNQLQFQTESLLESAANVSSSGGSKTSIEEFLKWTGHDVQSREEGGPVGSFKQGGQAKWLTGSNRGYPEEHNGQPLVAHGLEALFTKSGSKDGFIVPFDNDATRANPMLTMARLAQAKKLGFTNGPPGFEGGGLGLSGLTSNKTYSIANDKGWFEDSKIGGGFNNLKSGGEGNWFTNMFKGWGGTGGSGGNFGMGVGSTFGTPQAYQEPQSGGLGLVQRLIASHRGDELTQALLARTVFNRKAVIDKTGNSQMFRAKSGSFHDILHAPGQYPNVESGRLKGAFSNSELNAAGKAMKLAKDANELKNRLQEGGLDPAKAQQLLTSTMFKPGSGLNKGGLAGLLTGGGGVRFGNYTFNNKPTNAMNSLLGGMNPLMIKSMNNLIGNIVGGKGGESNMGKDLVMALASGVLGGKDSKDGGMMDMLFGMFGLPTKRGGDQKGGGMSAGLGTVMKGIFGGKGGKDKREERMEAQKKENDKHRQIMKFHAAEQKRAVQSSLFQRSKQNCDEVIAAVQANNNKCAQNAQSGSEAVARLSSSAQQQAGNSFMGIFKSLASKLSSSKSK